MLYHVRDGRLTQVTGDPEHPMTQGRLCVKLKDFADHHYHPERITYPMRRVGPKGSGQFERISWDDALAEIRMRWTEIIDRYGPEAIMPHGYLGHQGTLNGLTAGDAFFNRLGATVAEKTYCESGSSTAWHMTVGPTGGLDVESLKHSKYIIVWAMNMVSTNQHAWPFITEAQKAGAKVVVIDPIANRTAKQSDWHIQIQPGTDGALALGMINVIIEEGLLDDDYVEKYTLGFDELKERAAKYSPDEVERLTGVPAEDVRILAYEFATYQPAAIREGVALERSRGGTEAIRLITCLPALVGAWRYVGGGAVEMPIWEFPFQFDEICRPDWIPEDTRVVNELDLGSALTGGLNLDPPIKSLFVYNSNPASQALQQGKVMEGLKRDDIFTVASELFITDTARFADILLPATMQAEQYDLMVTWGHLYMMLNQPAIDPPGECVPNVEMFRRLARTMGFEDAYWERTDDEMLEAFYDWDSPQLQGITLNKLKEKGWMRLNVGEPDERAPHAEGNFKTPSGKCEFRSSLASDGNFVVPVWRSMYEAYQPGDPVDPVPDYLSPYESEERDPELAKRYPLNFVTAKAHSFLNSQYANEPVHRRRQGEQEVLVSTNDAEARGIKNGDYVRVFNDRGVLVGRASVSSDVMGGVITAALGFWPSLNRGGASANALSAAERHSNLGQAGAYGDNLVELELVE